MIPSKKMGESFPLRPCKLIQRKDWNKGPYSNLPSGNEWWRPWMKHLHRVQTHPDTDPDINGAQSWAPWSCEVIVQSEKGRLFMPFLSKVPCSRPNLGESFWLRERWAHSALPAAACSMRSHHHPEAPGRNPVQCVWASWSKCCSSWGRRRKVVKHRKWFTLCQLVDPEK